ncbi:hypothetical protein [Micromonospora sp. NBC_00421]|uniref:hypothetical protein n=1 Tax=Micromonospora sp. NBC_00421 TaxID=2975976 RepID=UPI002E20F81A
MTSDDIRRLADFLAILNDATTKHGIEVGAYGPADLRIDEDTVMQIRWDEERGEYLAAPQTA